MLLKVTVNLKVFGILNFTSCVQKEVAEFSCICERHIGTQSGGMDQVGFAKTFFSSVVIC